jgi:hypothetical protein
MSRLLHDLAKYCAPHTNECSGDGDFSNFNVFLAYLSAPMHI